MTLETILQSQLTPNEMNNKIEFYLREKQDLFDISIQELGSVEYCFGLLSIVAKTFGADKLQFAADTIENFYKADVGEDGTYLVKVINTEKIGDPKVVDKLKLTNFVVNNSGTPTFVSTGIGVWIIESDFTIT